MSHSGYDILEHDSEQWKLKKKHFFIISSSGKPVYSRYVYRYGDESKLSHFMGVVQTLIACFEGDNDILRSIHTPTHLITLLIKPHLYLLCASTTCESEIQIRDQLNCLYHHVIFTLTAGQIDRFFTKHPGFDLRRVIENERKGLDAWCDRFTGDGGLLLNGIEALRLEKDVREGIGTALMGAKCKVSELLYGMVVANGKLVTLIRPKQHSLHPSDLHQLYHLLRVSSQQFESSDSWLPICLPKFNDSGYLYAHVSLLAKDVAIVLLSTEKEAFFEIKAAKERVTEHMLKHGIVVKLLDAMKNDPYTATDHSVPGLRHFIYKSKQLVQYTQPAWPKLSSNGEDDRERIFRLYQFSHSQIHCRDRPLKLIWHVSKHESLLGWVTSNFEVYIAFERRISKSNAMASANTLIRWIKKEEQKLFVSGGVVY
ncbi:vacuolar fusion protein MON1 [Paraphysoderma sedebokerense]|nr:vacuolar fusion protein MON1 [Paraphysoderma sedebokerense]